MRGKEIEPPRHNVITIVAQRGSDDEYDPPFSGKAAQTEATNQILQIPL